MKTNIKWLWLCGLVALTLSAVAQTNTVPGSTPASLPTDAIGYWTLAIAGLTPLIVTGIRWFTPKVPTLVLPLLTPLIGIGLGLLVNWLAQAKLGWVDMAQAGALAVFVREVVNQAVTKRLTAATPDASKPTE